MRVFQVLLLYLVSESANANDELGCRDENGQLVDWYYLYKIPADGNHLQNEAEFRDKDNGLKFLYISSKSTTKDWSLSTKLINDSLSLPGNTLSSSVYEKNENNLIVLYNDQPPEGDALESRGHSKGVLVADKAKGFWIIHSVPHFPPVETEKYNYPNTGRIYGQSFLCISLNNNQINKVGQQLRFNEVNVYSSKVPDGLKGMYPNVETAILMQSIKIPPFNNLEEIESAGGVKFTSFAKAKRFNKELYEDYVAPILNDDFLVETWRHGGGNLDSNCSRQHKIYNVEEVQVENYALDFKTLQDHSKWGVSSTENKQWICVGDINRQISQAKRGGGTVCQESKVISDLYRKSVKMTAPCKELNLEINK